jgi:phosphoglycolate phosphatase-like HAD superfamily hydrolase
MQGGKFVFIDFDDTLSDPFLLHPQYVRTLGDLLSARFSGSADRWAKAAIDTLEMVEREYCARFERNPLSGYCAWLAVVRGQSAGRMFEQMKIAAPADIDGVARQFQYEALAKCDAAFPGAGDALRTICENGWRIQIASGQESDYLAAALIGAGLDRCIERRFGPDLVDCAKEGPEFYERIFAECGVRASDAVVVDDWPPAIAWALQTGAAVIQSKLSRERHFEVVGGVAAVMTDLRDLPCLLGEVVLRR